MKYIKQNVDRLIEKYDTNDPFKLCELIGIKCYLVDLHHELNGILQHINNHTFIYININLPKAEQLSTCGHELGHAVLHNKYDCTFLKIHSLRKSNTKELEADLFSSLLLSYKPII
ncbi:ImmA/IrrE family metallo-endopeptidase [Clostridium sp. LP20]|uniref:ImmA/IrrE family metallo-endopeptidase n=1 Tax=Clostridium sp. LP20 TaxID=3418665 RepID=UPI003EE7D726